MIATPARRGWIWAAEIAFALVAGVSYAYLLVGGRSLNPADLTWLAYDPAMNHVGWEFYRRSGGGWMSTFVAGLGYPYGTEIAMFDLVPSAAMLLRPFSGSLPENFQYLGLLLVLNLVLQAYFAVRLFRNVCGSDTVVVLIGAIFILIAPPLVFRVNAHLALTAHWLIIAALSYYFEDASAKGAARYLRPFFVLCPIAASINPYLTLMTALIAAAAVLRILLRRQWQPLAGLLCIAALAAVTAASFYVFGFLSLRGGYAGTGYRLYSMNLLAPIDPLMFPSLLLPRQSIGEGQYEGYNYLGLGVIVMLLAGLALRPAEVRKLATADGLPLLLLGAACVLLALSLTVMLGPWTVLKIGLGRTVENLLGYFRSSGRLYWPVHYLLIVAGVVLVCHVVPRRFRAIVLVGLLALQIADTQSLRARTREYMRTINAPAPLTDPVWQSLGRVHRHLVVVPPWQCRTDLNADGFARYITLPLLAARQGMTVNSVYAARYDSEQLKFFCLAPERIVAEGMRPDTAYVFSKDLFSPEIAARAAPSHSCRLVDGFHLCTRADAG